MLDQLIQVVEQALAQPYLDTQEERYRRRQIQNQLRLVTASVMTLQSLVTDIQALRVGETHEFSGTGNCEFGHEGVSVTMEWPNLAFLADYARNQLAEIKVSHLPKIWFVFHGDCSLFYQTPADSSEEAIKACRNAHPGSSIHAAVPGSLHGGLIMEGYAEDPVHCPKCGSRTDFTELPRDGWQVHTCLNQACQWSFVAIPDEEKSHAGD